MANKSSVSKAGSYQEIGAFWDEHDSTEFGEDEEAEFVLRLGAGRHYLAVDEELHARMRALAEVRGVSEETLANRFLRERLDQLEQERQGG
jgi:hypothetical protein